MKREKLPGGVELGNGGEHLLQEVRISRLRLELNSR